MKTSALFRSVLAAFAISGGIASGALNAAACCHPEIAATTSLPAASLYQAEVGFTTDDGKPFNLVELRGRPVAMTMFFPPARMPARRSPRISRTCADDCRPVCGIAR